jgi:hypothetical protein
MMMIRRETMRVLPRRLSTWIALVFLLIGLGAGGTFFYFAFRTTGKTIYDLLTENRKLRTAITNLTQERRIGYAKVLSQETREGRLFTEVLFVVTDPEDQTKRIFQCQYEIEGDVVFFDALIVKFSPELVMDGKEKALYLWRRVYGEKMTPEEGYPIEIRGEEPTRYAEVFSDLRVDDREVFWNEVWELADDPDRLASAGVQAIYGTAVYKKLRPGLIYIFNIDANGTFYPETVPDL